MSFANLLRMHSLKQELNILNNAISPYSNKYLVWFVVFGVGLFLLFFSDARTSMFHFISDLKRKGMGCGKNA